LTNRVIALAWAVDPLALSVFFPPQLTFALADVLLAFLSLPHPDGTSALVTRTHSTALNRLSFNSVPSIDS